MKSTFQITEVKNYLNRVTIYLNTEIQYADGRLNYINFVNRPPFNNFKTNELIGIDTLKIAPYSINTYSFADNSIVE